MTRYIDPQAFIDALLPVVDQCARATLIFFGQVADIGKAADQTLISDHAQEASTAFTVLDAAVQDILLGASVMKGDHTPPVDTHRRVERGGLARRAKVFDRFGRLVVTGLFRHPHKPACVAGRRRRRRVRVCVDQV